MVIVRISKVSSWRFCGLLVVICPSLDGFLVVSCLFLIHKLGLIILKGGQAPSGSWPRSWAGRFPVSRWGFCSVSVVFCSCWWFLGNISVVILLS